MSLAIDSLNLFFYNKQKWYPLVQQPLAQLGLFKLVLKKQDWFNVQWLLCGGCLCAIVFCALWVSSCPSKQCPVTDSWAQLLCSGAAPGIRTSQREGTLLFFPINVFYPSKCFLPFKCFCTLLCSGFPRCLWYLVLMCSPVPCAIQIS